MSSNKTGKIIINSNIKNNYKTLKVHQCCKEMNTNVDVNGLDQTTAYDTIVDGIGGLYIMTFFVKALFNTYNI